MVISLSEETSAAAAVSTARAGCTAASVRPTVSPNPYRPRPECSRATLPPHVRNTAHQAARTVYTPPPTTTSDRTGSAGLPGSGPRGAELQPHRQVDRPDVLGEGADRDEIDAGLGDGAHRLERHASRALELHRPAARVVERHRGAQVRVGEVIEHHDVGRAGKGFLELGERFDLDLDR